MSQLAPDASVAIAVAGATIAAAEEAVVPIVVDSIAVLVNSAPVTSKPHRLQLARQ